MVELEIGSMVWERAAPEANHDRRGGMVVDMARDETTGAMLVIVAVTGRERNRPTIATLALDAARIDDTLTEPPSTARRMRMARDICAALAVGGAKRWTDAERSWLGRAKELASEAWASTADV